jgi:formate dehydrogenase subunit beta
MTLFSKIEVKDKDLSSCLQGLFVSLLASDKIDALLIPCRLPDKTVVMPALIHNPEDLAQADPLAPAFPLNAARMASRLTKKRSGEKLGLVLRPCEIRAFIELIKLRQGSWEDVVIIGLDCLGAYTNRDYAKFSEKENSTRLFYETILDGRSPDGFEPAGACTVCEHPVPENADIVIGLYGVDYTSEVLVEAATSKGEALIQGLNLSKAVEPAGRKKAIDALVSDRRAKRDKMMEKTSALTSSIEKLSHYLSRCVNCYNCRVACPVCYCKECVFVTDVFDHDPYQYLQWARKKGKVKMPSDTDFFHLTRMAHIGLTCVGCGQCSNACPNDIPLMELFRTSAHTAQKAFGYEAGRRVDEPIPLAVFEKDEYEEIVGIKGVS